MRCDKRERKPAPNDGNESFRFFIDGINLSIKLEYITESVRRHWHFVFVYIFRFWSGPHLLTKRYADHRCHNFANKGILWPYLDLNNPVEMDAPLTQVEYRVSQDERDRLAYTSNMPYSQLDCKSIDSFNKENL